MSRLDTKDMERHTVEFRLVCDKARRRFLLANMSDKLDDLLRAHITNASEQEIQGAPPTMYKIPSSFTPDESEKLAEFLQNLLAHLQDASQRELLQEALRRSLAKTREMQHQHGVRVDPMCLFCMGMFSQPQLDCPPAPNAAAMGCSTPLAGNMSPPDGLDIDHSQPAPPHLPLAAEPVPDFEPQFAPANVEQVDITQQQQQPQQQVNGVSNDHNYSGNSRAQNQANGCAAEKQLQREQEPVPYQPNFNIPPTPDDENTESEDNTEMAVDVAVGEPAAAAAPAPAPANGVVKPANLDDSLASWMERTTHRGPSSELNRFIEQQISALESEEEEDEDEREKVNKGEIFNAHFVRRIEIEEEEDLRTKLSESLRACTQPACVSSIETQVRKSISTAQQVTLNMSSASQGRNTDRLSNSKQFIKHRKKRTRNNRHD